MKRRGRKRSARKEGRQTGSKKRNKEFSITNIKGKIGKEMK